jgi:hypothetical protein
MISKLASNVKAFNFLTSFFGDGDPSYIMRETFLLILPLCATFQVPLPKRGAWGLKIKGDKRIGPHSKDIISIIFGSLLGEGDVERKIGNGTRITFFQEAMHVKYIL